MSLFDFIFGRKIVSNVEQANDRLWLTTNAKLAGIRKEIIAKVSESPFAIILVAHFPNVLQHLSQIADENSSEIPIKATLADRLSTNILQDVQVSTADIVELIVAERHPLYSADENLIRFAEQLPCKCRITHHLSLDDPLLKRFTSESVGSILKMLAMTEEDAIESNLVSRQIKIAQQKIEATPRLGNVAADSAAEWIERNLPAK